MTDLHNLLLRLADAQFDFVLVGGYAAAAHGSTLVTEDLDVCANFSVANLMRLNKALGELHPMHRMTPHRIRLELTPDFCKGLKNLYLDTDLGQVDILGEIAGVGDYSKVLQHSLELDIKGRRVKLLDLDALINAKQALGRPRDKEAVFQLQAIKEKNDP